MASSIRDKLKRVTGPRSVDRSHNDFFAELPADTITTGAKPKASTTENTAFRASVTADSTADSDTEAPAPSRRISESAIPTRPAGVRVGRAAAASASGALNAWRDRERDPEPDRPSPERPTEPRGAGGSPPTPRPPQRQTAAAPGPDESRPATNQRTPCFHVSERVAGVFHRYGQSTCFVVSDAMDGHQPTGAWSPSQWLSLREDQLRIALATACDQSGLDPARALFFDLETNGFKASAGAVPFVIGTMRFRPGGRLQYSLIVMHSADDEAAALDAFCTLAERASMLVTFNGARFDVPFLEQCLQRQKMVRPALRRPHVDLYRLAKQQIGPRGRHKLTLLEERYLGIERDNDLPGSEAPRRWADFQQTGIAEGLLDVISHNRYDLWTMPALAAALYAEPLQAIDERKRQVLPLQTLASTAGTHLRTDAAPSATPRQRAISPPRNDASTTQRAAAPAPRDPAILRRLDAVALGQLRRAADAARATDPDEAIRLYERLSHALPTDAEAHATLSELYQHSRGEFAAALRHAIRAASLAPWSGALQRRVDELRQRLQ